MSRGAVLLAAVLAASPVWAAGDHPAMPMMAEPNRPLTADDLAAQDKQPLRTRSRDDILQDFRAQPSAPPRMAVFWNRQFGDQVSDWVSSYRETASAQGTIQGQVPEGAVNLDARGRATTQAETRGRREAVREPVVELQAGFIQQLTEAGVTVIDRAAMMRITDNQLEDGQFDRLSPDQARLEMRALAAHADLLVELQQPRAEHFVLRVIDVNTGAIRTVMTSNGIPPQQDQRRQWQTTDRGFARYKPAAAPEETGQELALQLLERITR